METLQFIAGVLAAYLVGAIPFGLIAGILLKGVDVRRFGSGNIGATNVTRLIGWKAGALVLVLDALKGYLPVVLLPRLLTAPGGLMPWFAPALALACIVGHNWPVYIGLRGGKGVATSLGVLLALSPPVVAIAAGVFLVTAIMSRYISLASLVASPAAAASAWLLGGVAPQTAMLVSLLAALVVVRHRGNVRRLLDGTEPRFGFGPKPACGETPGQGG